MTIQVTRTGNHEILINITRFFVVICNKNFPFSPSLNADKIFMEMLVSRSCLAHLALYYYKEKLFAATDTVKSGFMEILHSLLS